MSRIIAFVYGVLIYILSFCVILYSIGFVTGLWVPRTLDKGPAAPLGTALVVDILLLTLFAVQHSVMARPAFKAWWTRIVPACVERSTYVLFSSLALILLFWLWRPIPATVWHVANPQIAVALLVLSLLGFLMVLVSTMLINHFELFGLHQVSAHLSGRAMPEPRFRTPGLYRIVRHPIYLGFVIAFWAAPTMTEGHLLFALLTTGYILVGIALEERDLIGLFGEDYRAYRRRVAALIPFLGRAKG